EVQEEGELLRGGNQRHGLRPGRRVALAARGARGVAQLSLRVEAPHGRPAAVGGGGQDRGPGEGPAGNDLHRGRLVVLVAGGEHGQAAGGGDEEAAGPGRVEGGGDRAGPGGQRQPRRARRGGRAEEVVLGREDQLLPPADRAEGVDAGDRVVRPLAQAARDAARGEVGGQLVQVPLLPAARRDVVPVEQPQRVARRADQVGEDGLRAA